MAGRFLANERERHAVRILGRSSTSRPLSHLPGPHSVLRIRLFHVVFQVLSCAVYPPRLPGRYLRLTNASLRGYGKYARYARSSSPTSHSPSLDLICELEKLAGECTSRSIAVPPASLYTYHMYHLIARFRRTGGSSIPARVNVPGSGGLRYEIEQWISVRKHMNGASWYDPTHRSIDITGATDASSQEWGGVVRSPRVYANVFRAVADFPPDIAQAHINIKETFALHEVLRLLADDQSRYLRGSTVTIDVDNTTVFHSFRNGHAKDARMHHLVCHLF